MVDLSSKVTVFIIKAGYNPNYEDCKTSLKTQDCKFVLEEIENISPMSAAFQQMIDKCKTKYFVQVDQDMVVAPSGIRTLYESISSCKAPMYAYFLHDPHLNKDICGIKIYDRDIFLKYPYDLTSNSCEVEQLKRMEADGYKAEINTKVIGKHSPKWTTDLIYERYYTLMEKFKEFQYTWMQDLPKMLWESLKKNPTEENLYALLGALDSAKYPSISNQGEKVFFNMKKPAKGLIDGYLNGPNRCTLFVTSKCNLKCSWCRRCKDYMPTAPDMTIDMIDKILHKFPSINSFCICGEGEPFATDNLPWLIQHAKNKGKFVGLISNGTLLTRKFNALVSNNALPNYISISLNAGNKEDYIKTTGVDLFDTVLEGIRLINNKIPTYVSYVVTKSNVHKVPEFLRLVKTLPVKHVHLHNLLPHCMGNNYDCKEFWDDVLQFEDQHLLDEIKKLPEASIVESWPVLIKYGETRRNCLSPWKTINVDGSGSLSICNSIFPPDASNGNINDSAPWNNQYCRDFRNMYLTEQLPSCKSCFRGFCDTE